MYGQICALRTRLDKINIPVDTYRTIIILASVFCQLPRAPRQGHGGRSSVQSQDTHTQHLQSTLQSKQTLKHHSDSEQEVILFSLWALKRTSKIWILVLCLFQSLCSVVGAQRRLINLFYDQTRLCDWFKVSAWGGFCAISTRWGISCCRGARSTWVFQVLFVWDEGVSRVCEWSPSDWTAFSSAVAF